MNYEEILRCYEGETEELASTSFEFGLMNDLYYRLFYSYPEVDYWHIAMCVETMMMSILMVCPNIKLVKTINPNYIIIMMGIFVWRIMIGGTISR